MARSDKRTACITIGGACFAIAAIAVTMITYPFWPETADPPTAVLPPAGAKDVYAANNGEGSENRIVELEGFPTPITDEEVQRLRLLLNPSYQQGLPNLRAIAARIFLSVVGGRKKGDDFVVLEDGLTDWERLRSIRENAPSRTRPGSTDAGTSDNKTKKKMEEAMELSEHLESMLWAIRESHYRERLAAHLFKLVVPYYTQAAKDVTVGENESRPRATAGVSSASPEHGDDNSARDQYEKQLSVAKTKSRIVGRYTDFLLRFVLRLTADTLPNEVQALVASADLPVHQSHCNASECTAHECSAHEACNAGGCNARECAPQQPREACTPAASSGDGARPQASAPLTVAHGVAPHIQHTSYACRMGTCSHNHDTTHVTSNARGPSQAELGAATSAATSTSPATSAAPVVATPAAIAPPASPVGALIWQQRPPLGRARVTSTTSPSFTPATSNIATPVPGHRSLISPGVPEYVDPKTGMMFALGNGLPVLPEQDHRIPVTIITGPLGAGKTTLLKSSILDSRLGLWVVENDLGEGNVDKSLLGEGEGWQITGVAGGCACCEKKDDLKSAVQALVLSGAHFSAIVIELSGAADPSRVQADLFGHGGVIDLRLRLDAVISVADTPVLLKQIAEHASEPKKLESLSRDAIENFVDLEAMRRVGNQWTDGLDDTGRNQIAHADRVFLNKVSDLTEADIQKVKDYLAAERIFRRDPSNLRVINRDVKDSKGLVPVDQLLGTDLRSKWAHEAVTNYNVPLLVLPAPTSCGGCADENCHSCTSNTESQTSTSQLPAPEGKAALSSDPRNISIAPDCTHLVPGQGEGVPSSVTQAYASEGHLQDRSTVRPPEALPGNRRGPPPAVLDDEAAAATPSTGNTSTLQLCKNYFTQNRCGQEHTGDCGHHHGARGTHPIVPVAGTACTVAGTACTDRRGTVPPPPPPPPPPPVPRPSRRRGSAASSSQHSSGDNGCPRCSSDSSCQPSPAMPSTASSCSPATSSVPIDNRSAPGSPSPPSQSRSCMRGGLHSRPRWTFDTDISRHRSGPFAVSYN
ncbi:unnamed protein product [Amoebophrya sp. A25]|nr:unnamed protein product [Amoebophrya sp. A25]|eukprot:GSA25T00013492001.1